MMAFRLAGVDALMFRDGRPFNQSDEGSDAAISRFPPPPPTIAGALRLMLAARLGYPEPEKQWPKESLGHGTDWSKKGTLPPALRFSATLVERNGLLWFPCPLHLAQGVNDAGVETITALKPGPVLSCDLGKDIALPSAPAGLKGIKTKATHWINTGGMEAVINGKLPAKEDLVEESALAMREMRVGIGRDSGERKVIEGALYTAGFVRMADGVSLVTGVEGVEGLADGGPVMQRFGGEHRSAYIEPFGAELALPPAPVSLPERAGKFHYAAITLSPALFKAMPLPGGAVPAPPAVPDLPGRLVSACTGKPLMIGGWDSQARTPLAMRPALPAGSVFFMTCEDEREALAAHGRSIGEAQAWGFGQVLIARWEP